MATALTGDKVTVSVKNTFLNFVENDDDGDDDEGESSTLRRCSSEGSLSCRNSSRASNASRKVYTWMPSRDVVSTEDALETMSQSSWASCTKSQIWWLAPGDRSTGDAAETMSQSSVTSCLSSSLSSGSNMRSAPRAPWEIQEIVDAQVFVDVSSSSGMDAPLPPCSHLVKALHEETGIAADDLLKLESEGILEQIPRNAEGEIASIGSLKHSLGTCTPCIFWFRGICTKSLQCTYCHFRHPGQKAKRHKPNKRTRQLIRELKTNRSSEEAIDG